MKRIVIKICCFEVIRITTNTIFKDSIPRIAPLFKIGLIYHYTIYKSLGYRRLVTMIGYLTWSRMRIFDKCLFVFLDNK